MIDNLQYNGTITINKIVNGKTLKSKTFNSGTDLLFKTYALALQGQNIDNLLPTYIDIKSGDKSILNSNGISVVRSVLLEEEKENSENEAGVDEKIGTKVPCTRISASILASTINTNSKDNFTISLETPTREQLAYATIPNEILANITSGTQLLIVWDLYVHNPIVTQ